MRWIEDLKKHGNALVDALRNLLLPSPEPEPELAPVRVPTKRRQSRPRR